MSDTALASLRRHQIVLEAGAEETASTALPALYTGTGAQRYHAISTWDDSEISTILELLNDPVSPELTSLRVLELACGSGRVTLPLARAGYRVLATDLSPDMLCLLDQDLRESAARGESLGELIETRPASMADFSFDERFRAVCIPTGSITLLPPADRRACLSRVRDHLAPGGTLIVSTDLVPTDEPTTATIHLAPRVSLTEEVDPAAGLRRTTLVWGEERYASELQILPPSVLSAELSELGMRTVFQRSRPSEVLPGHANVTLGVVLP